MVRPIKVKSLKWHEAVVDRLTRQVEIDESISLSDKGEIIALARPLREKLRKTVPLRAPRPKTGKR